MMISEMIEQTGMTDKEIADMATKGGHPTSPSSVWCWRNNNGWRLTNLPRNRLLVAMAYALNRSVAEIAVAFMEEAELVPAGLSEHVRQAEQRLIAEQAKPRRTGRVTAKIAAAKSTAKTPAKAKGARGNR
jgi:hypothetical protein